MRCTRSSFFEAAQKATKVGCSCINRKHRRMNLNSSTFMMIFRIEEAVDGLERMTHGACNASNAQMTIICEAVLFYKEFNPPFPSSHCRTHNRQQLSKEHHSSRAQSSSDKFWSQSFRQKISDYCVIVKCTWPKYFKPLDLSFFDKDWKTCVSQNLWNVIFCPSSHSKGNATWYFWTFQFYFLSCDMTLIIAISITFKLNQTIKGEDLWNENRCMGQLLFY